MRLARWALLAVVACGGGAGCDDSSTPDGGASDGGASDGGASDAARADAAARDAGREDAAMIDAGHAQPTLTVMTLNLHCLRLDGTVFTDNAARMAAVADAALAEGVDAIAVQEACASDGEDAMAMLAEALGSVSGETWARHWVFAHVAWEGTADEAREGVGILARSLARPTELVHRGDAGLRRVAAAADVTTPLGVVRLTSVHFDHASADARRSQAREAAVTALSEGDPSLGVIVAGDLNARPGSDAHAAFTASGFVRASDPVAAGRIDHVFAHRGAGLRAVDAWLRFDDDATRVSDHPAVLVRFVAAPPAPVTVTRLVAEHDPGAGHHLWIRGDAAPLGWDEGWPMHALAPDRWRWVSTEVSGDFELKVLVDDTGWQSGDNVAASAGGDVVIRPSF